MSARPPDLLDGLSADDAARMMALGAPRTYPAGTVLFELGSDAGSLYLLVSGHVDLSLPMRIRDREEDVLLEEKRPGETLGWSGLVPPHRFTLKATVSVESEILAFPRAKLQELFDQSPALGLAVTRNVAAVIGHRLQIFRTLWLREMQRMVESRLA